MLQKPLAGIFKVLPEMLFVYFFVVNWRQPFQYLTTFLALLDVSNTAPMPLQPKKRGKKKLGGTHAWRILFLEKDEVRYKENSVSGRVDSTIHRTRAEKAK